MKHTVTRPRKPQKEQITDICDNCAYAAFDMKFENQSLDGKPTLIICPYEKWNIVVGSKACKNFVRRKTA